MKTFSYCFALLLGALVLRWVMLNEAYKTTYQLRPPKPAKIEHDDTSLKNLEPLQAELKQKVQKKFRADHTPRDVGKTLPEKITSETPGEYKEQKREVQLLLQKYIEQYPRCTDINSLTDPRKIKFERQGAEDVYLGDTIRFNVYLFDGYGKAKTVGGDHLRARLFTNALKASTTGRVYDYKNGSYSVYFPALWTGQAVVEIELLYPSEIIAANFHIRNTWDFSDCRAVFKRQNVSETTLCSTDISRVEPKYANGVCDFSYWNKAMKWYCGKPAGVGLTCNHLSQFSRDWANYTRGLNACERNISNSWKNVLKRSNVTIFPRQSNKKQLIVDQPTTECWKYNTTKLWYLEDPTGYFYNGTWRLLHCKGISSFFGDCFYDTKIYLWGDSTLNQWFKYVRNKASCGCKLKRGSAQWKRKVGCYCGKYNSLVVWLPHCLPVVGAKSLKSYWLSLLQQVENDSNSKFKKRILVVHLYAHVQMYSFTFYADHLFALRKDIESILKRDSKLIVFIKMPHTHRETRHKTWSIRQPDIIGYIYTDMIRTVFSGLHDRIIVLNNRDSTNAVRNLELHPSGNIVDSMFGQMLSYICHPSEFVKS